MFNTSFVCLWGGQAFSNFGDRLYMLAITTFVYQFTDSVLLASFVPFIRLVMQLVSSLIAPVVTNKVSLKTVLIISQLVQCILLLFLVLWLIVLGKHSIYIAVIVALLAFLQSWVNPLKYAMLPKLILHKELVKANNIMSITNQVVLFAGWIGGGILVSKLGPLSSLWITLGCFFVSSLLFSWMRRMPMKLASKQNGFSLKTVLEGWVFVVKNPLYRKLFTMSSFLSLAGSVWSGAIILVFVKDIIHKDESWWGFLNGAWLVGTILGGFLFAKWIRKKLSSALVAGLLGNASMILVFVQCTDPFIALGVSFLMGIPYQVHDVAKRTVMQMNAEEGELAQIFAAYQAIGTAFFGLGIFIMGLFVDYVGIQSVYYIASFFVMIPIVFAIQVKKELARSR